MSAVSAVPRIGYRRRRGTFLAKRLEVARLGGAARERYRHLLRPRSGPRSTARMPGHSPATPQPAQPVDQSEWYEQVTAGAIAEGYAQVKTWDSYLPSTGHSIWRELMTKPGSYRLIAMDHDGAQNQSIGSSELPPA